MEKNIDKKGVFMADRIEFIISRYLKRFSLEYDYMWSELAKLTLNKENEVPQICENNGEGWQYMGSCFIRNNLMHQFRHRCHPKNSERINLNIKASQNFKEFIREEFPVVF
jgi:hypothetical protein